MDNTRIDTLSEALERDATDSSVFVHGAPLQCTPENEFFSEGSNNKLCKKSWHQCGKNKHHTHFIAIQDSEKIMKNLPAAFKDDSTMEAIRQHADRTVRIRVYKTSKDRPDVFPNSDLEFPLKAYRGRNFESYGTGYIFPGEVHDNRKCPCTECVKSAEAKHTYQTVYVLTANHVVFDNKEAATAKCDMFYDKEYSKAIVLDGLKLYDGDGGESGDGNRDQLNVRHQSDDNDKSQKEIAEMIFDMERINAGNKSPTERLHDLITIFQIEIWIFKVSRNTDFQDEAFDRYIVRIVRYCELSHDLLFFKRRTINESKAESEDIDFRQKDLNVDFGLLLQSMTENLRNVEEALLDYNSRIDCSGDDGRGSVIGPHKVLFTRFQNVLETGKRILQPKEFDRENAEIYQTDHVEYLNSIIAVLSSGKTLYEKCLRSGKVSGCKCKEKEPTNDEMHCGLNTLLDRVVNVGQDVLESIQRDGNGSVNFYCQYILMILRFGIKTFEANGNMKLPFLALITGDWLFGIRTINADCHGNENDDFIQSLQEVVDFIKIIFENIEIDGGPEPAAYTHIILDIIEGAFVSNPTNGDRFSNHEDVCIVAIALMNQVFGLKLSIMELDENHPKRAIFSQSCVQNIIDFNLFLEKMFDAMYLVGNNRWDLGPNGDQRSFEHIETIRESFEYFIALSEASGHVGGDDGGGGCDGDGFGGDCGNNGESSDGYDDGVCGDEDVQVLGGVGDDEEVHADGVGVGGDCDNNGDDCDDCDDGVCGDEDVQVVGGVGDDEEVQVVGGVGDDEEVHVNGDGGEVGECTGGDDGDDVQISGEGDTCLDGNEMDEASEWIEMIYRIKGMNLLLQKAFVVGENVLAFKKRDGENNIVNFYCQYILMILKLGLKAFAEENSLAIHEQALTLGEKLFTARSDDDEHCDDMDSEPSISDDFFNGLHEVVNVLEIICRLTADHFLHDDIFDYTETILIIIETVFESNPTNEDRFIKHGDACIASLSLIYQTFGLKLSNTGLFLHTISEYDLFINQVLKTVETELIIIPKDKGPNYKQEYANVFVSMRKTLKYIKALRKENASTAFYVLLQRVSNLRERFLNREFPQGVSGPCYSDEYNFNDLFCSRQNTFEAVTKMASGVHERMSKEIKPTLQWIVFTLDTLKLLEVKTEDMHLDDYFVGLITQSAKKALITHLILSNIEYAVNRLSQGDFNTALQLLRFYTKTVEILSEDISSGKYENTGEVGITDELTALFQMLKSCFYHFDFFLNLVFCVFLTLLIPIFWEDDFKDFSPIESEILGLYALIVHIGNFEFEKVSIFVIKSLPLITGSDKNKVRLSMDSLHNTLRGNESLDNKLRSYLREQVVLECVTHDPVVINRLSKMKSLPSRLPFNFIISHPHGYYKQITFGKLKDALCGKHNSYTVYTMKKGMTYKLSEPISGETKLPFHPSNDAIEPHKEYRLDRDVQLGVTNKMSQHDYSFATDAQNFKWFTFPSGTTCIDEQKQTSEPLPENLQFDVTGYDLARYREHKFASCLSHDIPTCPGSSGALINCSHRPDYLYTHCGFFDNTGYTSLSPPNSNLQNRDINFKDIFLPGRLLFMGGADLPFYQK